MCHCIEREKCSLQTPPPHSRLWTLYRLRPLQTQAEPGEGQ
jgi:hypothetical protein